MNNDIEIETDYDKGLRFELSDNIFESIPYYLQHYSTTKDISGIFRLVAHYIKTYNLHLAYSLSLLVLYSDKKLIPDDVLYNKDIYRHKRYFQHAFLCNLMEKPTEAQHTIKIGLNYLDDQLEDDRIIIQKFRVIFDDAQSLLDKLNV